MSKFIIKIKNYLLKMQLAFENHYHYLINKPSDIQKRLQVTPKRCTLYHSNVLRALYIMLSCV